MNRTQTIRQMAPHVVIALAVCVGAWMALVQPKVEALAEMSAERDDVSLRLTPEQQWRLVRHLEGVQEWLDEVEALSVLSRDSNLLFSTIMELAEDRGVQIVSVQPGPASRQTARGRDRGDESDSVATANLEIVARGRFESVAAFIDALTQHSPFIRPQSLHIAPASDGPPPTISARVMCDVLSFTPPAALAHLKGTRHAP